MAVPLILPSILVLVSSCTMASAYTIKDTIIGSDFYNFFNWDAIPDPTHGRVNYVDQRTSVNLGLTSASSDSFILRADYTSVLDPSGPGRNSVRLSSWNTYTQHLVVFNVRHMPEGCGTWPAIWQFGPNWPWGGEIDIVEGVNNMSPNLASLHTSPNCMMPPQREQTGNAVTNNCDVFSTNNQGCGVRFPTTDSYGPEFNNNGGGWVALERTLTYHKIWFWPRNDATVPDRVRNGDPFVDPDTWGVPTAYFPNTNCDFPSHFSEHNILINLTFCGDWAGAVYPASGCPSTCEDFVNNNPDAFVNAYFDFASIRTYTPQSPIRLSRLQQASGRPKPN